MRRSALVLAATLLVLSAGPVPAAPAAPGWTVAFDREVRGDLAVAGNSVTRCPPSPQAATCRSAEAGAANGAMNNAYAMVWSDTDDDPATTTSSSALLALPPGAHVVHATLLWAGDLRTGSTGPCGRTAKWPPGTPGGAVRLRVGASPSATVAPGHFSAQPGSEGNDSWYGASADVTSRFAGRSGPVVLTVANVWTGRGVDCAGGWSVVAAWSDGHTARHRITVYTGPERVADDVVQVPMRPPGLRAAGGTARLGVVALEGDRALASDTLAVDSRALPEPSGTGGPDNFFTSSALGARAPARVNTMGTDAKTVAVGPGLLRPGDHGLDVAAVGGTDDYLLQALALSVPLPDLSVTTAVDHPVVHAGDLLTQHAVVTNSGGVAVHDVAVELGIDPSCREELGVLEPGEHRTASCTAPAGTRSASATATGTDPADDALTASATTPARVIHPALEVDVGVPHPVVLADMPVDHDVRVTNTGDAPLHSVQVHGLGCAPDASTTLAPGAGARISCVARPSTAPVTATAVDELGAAVTSTGHAEYRIVRPDLVMTVLPPVIRAQNGAEVTLTVRLRNPSEVPLSDVVVTGEPAACHWSTSSLPAGATKVYTCRITVTDHTVVRLAASATPAVPGLPATAAFAVHRTARIALALQQPVVQRHTQVLAAHVPPPPPPAVRPARHVQAVRDDGPLRAPTTPAILAVLGVLVMSLSLGGLSTAARRR